MIIETTRQVLFSEEAGNGIENMFAKEIETKSLCVSDDSGAKTCITKAQLDALLATPPLQGVVPDSSGEGGNSEITTPAPPQQGGEEITTPPADESAPLRDQGGDGGGNLAPVSTPENNLSPTLSEGEGENTVAPEFTPSP